MVYALHKSVDLKLCFNIIPFCVIILFLSFHSFAENLRLTQTNGKSSYIL